MIVFIGREAGLQLNYVRVKLSSGHVKTSCRLIPAGKHCIRGYQSVYFCVSVELDQTVLGAVKSLGSRNSCHCPGKVLLRGTEPASLNW